MRAIELFSGIGGMHFALKECDLGKNIEVVLSVDINPVANNVYRHFFPLTNHKELNILKIKPEQINTYNADILLMSPPCQPFTRNGLVKDINDERTKPFLHIIKNLIPQLKSLKYILVENVKGFECSITRGELVNSLKQCGFNYREFILSPTHFGICNSRTRYYLLAKKEPMDFVITSNEIVCENTWDTNLYKSIKKVSDVLCESGVNLEKYLLNDNILLKYHKVLDVVSKDSDRSCCFTRSYSTYVHGTGSIFSNLEHEKIQKIIKNDNCDLETLKSLKLRFFTPSEVAKFMCFPISSFPVSDKKAYQLLGNSVNVYVVSRLINLLLS
ncbi:tRNA (cytosine(38)-C(5))-methyltransferase [Daktulosphaira vitifoliae]|uniref:tRNA (cytosine(38)-C(5))-methyltransferase n=1 Tax=Daktulosphaira vitifoliae TaxID=58002 RepID=UPI0021A97D19|nr:tRNA (cytosine(38)-C(5))-methyltransferase [Daktulosphaira vitifoliae]